MTPTLPGFVYTAIPLAHAHDLEGEMGQEGDTRLKAQLRATLTEMGGDGAKMVVAIHEHLETFDPEEYPAVSLLAFASAPLR